jgi:integral membrane protein
MNEKHIRILATVATIAAVCMYTSYGLQTQSHLAGRAIRSSHTSITSL